jgi:ketosteroid isomerase-like protein
MSTLDTVNAIQAAAFGKDWDRFRSLLADDVTYRVGNVFQATGPRAVADYLRDLPGTEFAIQTIDIRGNWATPSEALAEYTMSGLRLRDNKTVRYPCADLYRFQGDKLRDWRVYPIEPTFVAPRSAVTLAAPPRTPAGAGLASLGTVNAFQAALGKGDWGAAKSYLTEDVVLAIADRPEVKGPAAVQGALGELFGRELKPTGAQFVGAWEFPGVLLTELVVQAERLRSGQAVSYPCVETYRFEGDRVREWRIYPIEATLLAPH